MEIRGHLMEIQIFSFEIFSCHLLEIRGHLMEIRGHLMEIQIFSFRNFFLSLIMVN